MIAVIETQKGTVLQVVLKGTQEQAEIIAKQMCQENGIVFEGDVSCDGNVKNYSVQIATSR